MNRLDIKQISLSYNHTPVVEQVSFHLQPGELVGLIGPNGCGKSTIIKAISRVIGIRSGEVKLDGREIKLTPTEYRLLQELVLNAGKVLTHSLLLGRVWGPEYAEEREYLHVFIGRLRKELGEDQEKPKYIITVPGIGYRFRE